MSIPSAGYIVHDNNHVIWGTGKEADDAWAEARANVEQGNAEKYTDEQMIDNWGFRICSASLALLEDVQARGGDISWYFNRSVACSIEE